MKSKTTLLSDVLELAKQSVTSIPILEFSIDKGRDLSNFYNADCDIVLIGMCLMDIKLKEALALGKGEQHVAMALEFAREFLKHYDITEEEFHKIINCIEAHHGDVPFSCIEAEICTNADCYIFIHPIGVFTYLGVWAKRTDVLEEQIEKTKYKLEEKHSLLSLDKAKEDLEEYYQMFLKMFDEVL